MTPAELVTTRRVLCVVGPGGVGKTTTAAALGVCAAAAGRRVLVITIDPARRLASAMGLAELAQVPREVRVPLQEGSEMVSMQAMMLDLKAAWDDMVRRLARDDEERSRILDNRFYHTLSTALAGAQEYVATEQLYTLCTERDYDLIVLDTPPSLHAIDFLEAPGRLLDVLESDAFQLLLAPVGPAGRTARRLFDLSGRYVVQTLSRLAGGEMLTALYEFFAIFHGMYPAFRDRSLGFREIFTDASTAFVVVSTPATQALREAALMVSRLAQDGLHLGALVVNQTTELVNDLPPSPTVAESLPSGLDPEQRSRLTRGVVAAIEQRNHRARREQREIEAALGPPGGTPRSLVPRLPRDVHDMTALVEIARLLCPTLPPPQETAP